MKFSLQVFTMLFLFSCSNELPLAVLKTIPTDHIFSVRSFRQIDGEISYVGGDIWAIGIQGIIDPISESNVTTDSMFNGILLDQSVSDESYILSGIDGFLYCNSGACQVRRTNNFDRIRASAFTDSGYMVAGGAGFEFGYLYRYTADHLLDSLYQIPFVVDDIVADGDIVYLFGFGGCMRSIDGGVHWEYTDLQGGHFIRATIVNNDVFAINTDGDIYINRNFSLEWERNSKVNLKKIQDLHVNEFGFVVVVGLDQELAYGESIYGSTDWRYFKTDSPQLRSCLFLDASAILIGGDDGYIAIKKL